MADSIRKRMRSYTKAGWTVVHRPGGHLMLTHPDAAFPVFTSFSPSDWRAAIHNRLMMRRALSAPKPKDRP